MGLDISVGTCFDVPPPNPRDAKRQLITTADPRLKVCTSNASPTALYLYPMSQSEYLAVSLEASLQEGPFSGPTEPPTSDDKARPLYSRQSK